jgi:DNA-binding FadR family transcriptional regulator
MEPVRNSSGINEIIQSRLMHYLRSSRLQPGDSLPSQARLAATLGVSQAALREAMRSLEALGIIEARVGSGWYVKKFSMQAIAKGLAYSLEMSQDDFLDLMELRETLECSLVERAIPALSPANRAALLEIAEQMEAAAAAGENARNSELDLAFHRTLFVGLRNRLLSELLDIVWALYPDLPAKKTPEGTSHARVDAHNHLRIAQAVQAGDSSLAKRRLQETFQQGMARIRNQMCSA